MLRLEARNSQVPIERKPPWIKTRLRTGPAYTELKSLVRSEGLHTVCEEAGCPNIFECWEDREATFLIGGDQCTRRCDFCQIDTGKSQPLDEGEPRRVAESVAAMGLRYATVTGVARDDLADGGAWLYAQVCREIHAAIPGCGVELREEATELGFAGVMSGPLVRSSYRAGRLYAQAIEQRAGSVPAR